MTAAPALPADVKGRCESLRAKANDAEVWAESYSGNRQERWLLGFAAEMREAATALEALASRAEGEWRSIDSAPKDGTVIDLYGTRNGKPDRFPDGRWSEDFFGGNPWVPPRFSWKHLGWDIYGRFEYTHWRERPAAPAREGGGS